MAQSSHKVAYVTFSFAVCEDLWFIRVFKPRDMDQNQIFIAVDNKDCICLTKNNTLSERTRHINDKFQVIMNNNRNGHVGVKGVASHDSVADIMTKSLGKFCSRRFVII